MVQRTRIVINHGNISVSFQQKIDVEQDDSKNTLVLSKDKASCSCYFTFAFVGPTYYILESNTQIGMYHACRLQLNSQYMYQIIPDPRRLEYNNADLDQQKQHASFKCYF